MSTQVVTRTTTVEISRYEQILKDVAPQVDRFLEGIAGRYPNPFVYADRLIDLCNGDQVVAHIARQVCEEAGIQVRA